MEGFSVKKAAVLLLAVWILTALTACGKSDSATKEPYVPPTYYLDQSDEQDAVKAEKIENAKKGAAHIESILSADELEQYNKSEISDSIHYLRNTDNQPDSDEQIRFDVTVDGLHVQYGDYVSVLINDGYQLEGEDKEVPAGMERSWFTCENPSTGRKIGLKLANPTDAHMPAKDCRITGIDFKDNCSGVDYQGLTGGNSAADVIETLGIPSYSIDVGFTGVYASTSPRVVFDYGYGGGLRISFDYDPEADTTSLVQLYFY